MGEWREVKIGDITNLYQGLAINKKTNYLLVEKSALPLLRIKDLQENTEEFFINDKEAPKKCIANENDLIFTRTGIVGKVFMGKKGVVHNNCFRIVSKNDDVYLPFYYHYFNRENMRDYLTNISAGSVQPDMNHTIFKTVKVPFPPLKEQKAIAQVLSSLDDKIDFLHRQNKTLEEMAQTLFRQWFINGNGTLVPSKGEAKASLPNEWEVGVLDDILTVKGGTTPSTKNDEYWNGSICWSTPKDLSLNSDMYLFDTARKITESGLAKIGSGLLPKGTILLSSRAPVGYLAIVEVPLAINQGYIAILDDKDFSKYFIFLWLRLNMKYIISNANGSTFLEISKTVFKSLEITKPPKELRKKFDEIVIDNFEKIKVNTKQIKTLENLRDTLIPKLMSGDVRVKL